MSDDKSIPIENPMAARPGPIYVPPGGPPRVPPPSRDIYAAMGEQNIFDMLAAVYEEFGRSSIKEMFPKNLPGSPLSSFSTDVPSEDLCPF